MRFAVDTGGTFTDLVVEDDDGNLSIYKSATTPADPIEGILNVFAVAAEERGTSRERLLGEANTLIHGTTRGLNAVLTQQTARTAMLVTAGHPDILLIREGGRSDVFDLRQPYPDPYVPRRLTFEVPERIGPDGAVVRELDEGAVTALAAELAEADVEAIAVCLLWSIVNPAHELRTGELLAAALPDVPVTLSHQLNPCLREYRRASATAIDASLKPIMSAYIHGLQARLEAAGFDGRLLIVTSFGGALDADEVAAAPIHSLNSGPSMAPVAGRYYSGRDAEAEIAVVADTGGTSYDVSLVRRGRIPWTRETWLGKPYFGHMTGLPSVDVRSVGAGGGSIAWVDRGGLLNVGPQSAGADPGPACYGRGGESATVTDACLVLGLVDADFFLGGRERLEPDLARAAIERDVSLPLSLGIEEAAAAILGVATERMVSAIEEITIHEGIDPREAVLVGGGGAAGFNTVAIARRLGCSEVIVPALGPALSAAGALISELSRSFEIAFRAGGDEEFDAAGVNQVLAELERRAQAFIDGPGADAIESRIDFTVEARYPNQVWELEVPLPHPRLDTAERIATLRAGFHALHRDIFAVADESSPVEFESWHARARCKLAEPAVASVGTERIEPGRRRIYLPEFGPLEADVWRLEALPVDELHSGPAIVETETTSITVDPDSEFRRRPSGTLHVVPGHSPGPRAAGRPLIADSEA